MVYIPKLSQAASFGLSRFADVILKKIRNRAGYSSLFSKAYPKKSNRPKSRILRQFGYARFFRKQKSCLFLTIHPFQASLIDVFCHDKTQTFEKAFTINFSGAESRTFKEEPLGIQALQTQFKKHAVQSKQIVVSLSEALTVQRVIQVNPQLSDSDILEILIQQMNVFFSLSSEAVYFDFKRLKANDPNALVREVLVVVAQKRIVEPYLKLVKDLGMRVVRVLVLSQAESEIALSNWLDNPGSQKLFTSLIQLKTGDKERLNLLPWRAQSSKHQKILFVSFFLGMSLFVLISMNLAGVYFRQLQTYQMQRNHFLEQVIQKQTDQIAQAKRITQERASLIKKLLQMKKLQFRQNRTMRFLYDIANILPPDVYLTEMRRSDGIFLIQGCAAFSHSISQVMDKMALKKWSRSVTLSEVQNAEQGICGRANAFKLRFMDSASIRFSNPDALEHHADNDGNGL